MYQHTAMKDLLFQLLVVEVLLAGGLWVSGPTPFLTAYIQWEWSNTVQLFPPSLAPFSSLIYQG